MPKDSKGNEIEFVNHTTVDGIEWAQIAGRFGHFWWRTGMPDSTYRTTYGPWVIDLEDVPDEAEIKQLQIKLKASKVLNKKVAKQDLRKAVQRVRSVHTKARQVEGNQEYGARSWFA